MSLDPFILMRLGRSSLLTIFGARPFDRTSSCHPSCAEFPLFLSLRFFFTPS